MKLRNKKTGEIIDIYKGEMTIHYDQGRKTIHFKHLEDLDEWEDYEEPKGNWTIDPMNENYIDDGRYTAPDELERYEELGLKFNTEEEAEKAVDKLKAWKRLKDKGLRFKSWYDIAGPSADNPKASYSFNIKATMKRADSGTPQYLDLLFGGEE